MIPKGNAPAALAPHLAAAKEAEEEAGVLGGGLPDAARLLSLSQATGNGASLMVDVEVFPLAVARADGLEGKLQRERRWFSLAEAAEAVEEGDLRDLIRSFAARRFTAARRSDVFERRGPEIRVDSMFAWFQRLLPKTGNFFDLFEAHASPVAAADARPAAPGWPAMRDHVREIIEREHDADKIIREVLRRPRDLPHAVRSQRDHQPDRLDGRCDRRDAGGRAGDRAL